MTVLSTKQVLVENNAADVNSITSISLKGKSLTDVSCLSDFKNLEKLDLSSNSLSSLEGLKSCAKLKWLSVVQNNLQSLKGVEGLVNLSVLNAGKNKLKSMEEVRSLVSLRALILNDNEIVSLCKLGGLKELNTLVLSRNPIRKIGESLAKVKNITKLSLSNCRLQSIDSAIKSCTELKELRLANNEIKTLPDEMSQNVKIQNLDMGSNLIKKWSDLKVLSSLLNLRNLNLHGNPVAEKDTMAEKIRKLVPRLQIYNGRPMEKSAKNEKSGKVDIKQAVLKGDKSVTNEDETNIEPGLQKEVERKKRKQDKALGNKVDSDDMEEGSDTKSKKLNIEADDGKELEFKDVFPDYSFADGRNSNQKNGGAVVIVQKKKKKLKVQATGSYALQLISPEVEVGLGGPSAWGED